nr:glycosyltransferase [Acuticoccus kalidii]
MERPRTIYLISPQKWCHPKVSKHHYALTLAGLGHRVYFIEPPHPENSRRPVVLDDESGVRVVKYRAYFPYWTKFHAPKMFDLLMRVQAKYLIDAIGESPEIVWDFDNACQFVDLRVFGRSLKIFHPVDDVARRGCPGKRADMVLSTSRRHLEGVPSGAITALVGHGLSEPFAECARAVVGDPAAAGPRGRYDRPVIGYVGNLDLHGIDWDVILQIARQLPHVTIWLIGPGERGDVDGARRAVHDAANVRFLGRKDANEILSLANEINLWLMAYDGYRDPNGATNPHKLLEYLATGKPIVSNRTEAHCDTGLIAMPPDLSNETIPELVSATLAELDFCDSDDMRRRRAAYALTFGYEHHLAQIDLMMDSVVAETRKGWMAKSRDVTVSGNF